MKRRKTKRIHFYSRCFRLSKQNKCMCVASRERQLSYIHTSQPNIGNMSIHIKNKVFREKKKTKSLLSASFAIQSLSHLKWWSWGFDKISWAFAYRHELSQSHQFEHGFCAEECHSQRSHHNHVNHTSFYCVDWWIALYDSIQLWNFAAFNRIECDIFKNFDHFSLLFCVRVWNFFLFGTENQLFQKYFNWNSSVEFISNGIYVNRLHFDIKCSI